MILLSQLFILLMDHFVSILDNINNTSMNVFIQVSFFFWVLSSLHIFNFSKKNAKVFQWSSTNVHSHQQGMRIPVVLELHQHLRASVFFHFINIVNVLSYLPMLDCSNVNCLYWEIHGSWLKFTKSSTEIWEVKVKP